MRLSNLKLSDRLYKIATYVPKGSRIADIGTDHCHIPIWLILGNVVESAIASDIKKGPLEAARRSAAEYGVLDKIDFRLSDGLAEIDHREADTLIIAGMGGENIAEIIESSDWKWEDRHRLILQPMTKQAELCGFLYENGFTVLDEVLAKDGGEIYRILLVGYIKSPIPADANLWVGQSLLEKKDPLLPEYLQLIISKTRKAISGVLSGNDPDTEKLNMLRKRLEEFKTMKEMLL
ncbi:MAG: SAM-dependent methyltransferase [Clostridiales bacterium]|jgi:tRNA (adenine22-N1)-methyltransferase|nr:SAM-dependent methyltransferase [Clostridiales bacterium]